MSEDGTMIGDGDFRAVARVDSQGLISAGDHQKIGDVDGLAGGDIHAADGVGAFKRRRRLSRRGSRGLGRRSCGRGGRRCCACCQDHARQNEQG